MSEEKWDVIKRRGKAKLKSEMNPLYVIVIEIEMNSELRD